MNLRQLINLIEAESSVQGSAAGYAPAQPTSPADDDTETGGAAKPASTPDPKLGIAANSPAITGKAPADNMKNAGDVARAAQGGSDTLGASNMASAPSAAPTPAVPDTRGAAAMASRPATSTPASAASAEPAKKVNFGAVGSGLSPAPANPDTRGAEAMASRSTTPTNNTSKVPAIPGVTVAAGTPTNNTSKVPAIPGVTVAAGTPTEPVGGAAKPAPAADTYSTEKGLFGGDVTVRTDAQGRKFVPNPRKQGAMANFTRGEPDEVAYRSADDIKQGVSNLADRFKSFFGGGKAPDTRGAAAMASRSAQSMSEDTDMSELRRLSGLPLNEKAASKQQQKFMGMVHAMQKGDRVKGASSELKKAAKGMSKKDARDFASTKHKGLPNKVTESVVLEAGNTVDHILNRFKHETKNFLKGQEISGELYDALYDYYKESGDMPYSVAKAPAGDTYQWIEQHLENELEVMGYQRHTESSSHALSELARLAGLSEAGPGRRPPAPNYQAIANRRMASMATTPPSDGPQDMGDVSPGEIATLDLTTADKSNPDMFPPETPNADMTADQVIARDNPGQLPAEKPRMAGKKGSTKLAGRNMPSPTLATTEPPRGGSAKPAPSLSTTSTPSGVEAAKIGIAAGGPKAPAEPQPDRFAQDTARQKAEVSAELAKLKGFTPIDTEPMTMKESEELNQIRRIAGLRECDMGMDQQDSMNVSTNMSSNGTKSVSISAQGDKADELLQMLKMAGMRAHDDHDMNHDEPEIVLVSGDDEAMMEDVGGIQVHDLSDMDDGSAYDETQVSDEIHDGDVIITRNGVGVMVEAWPVIVTGNSTSFHKLKDTSWEEFEGGKYAESAQKAMEVSGNDEMVDEAERVTQYSNTPDEEYETVAAIIRQGNDLNREKKQFSTDRGRDNPMAFELEESLADMLESIKVHEGEAFDAAWKKTQAERGEYEKNSGKKYYDTPSLVARHDQELSKARAADDAAKDAKRSPLGRVANTLSRGFFGQEIDEANAAADPYAGIEAERPYKDPKTGKMVTPPRGATMPPPDNEFPAGDKRNLIPPTPRKK